MHRLELSKLLSLTRAIVVSTPHKPLNNNVGYEKGHIQPKLVEMRCNCNETKVEKDKNVRHRFFVRLPSSPFA
jgi:hypothetical protein